VWRISWGGDFTVTPAGQSGVMQRVAAVALLNAKYSPILETFLLADSAINLSQFVY